MEWAQSYLNLHKEVEKDYIEKYKLKAGMLENSNVEVTNSEVELIMVEADITVEETDIFKELKAFRLEKSR